MIVLPSQPSRNDSRSLVAVFVTGALVATALAATIAPAHQARAEATVHPCVTMLERGMQEERRARFPEALQLLDQARQEEACRVAAQLGLARTYNSMNEHKKALVAARWILGHTDDPQLSSQASYEIGRALHKPGRKMTKQKAEAEAAFLRAIELAEGENRNAVRALMRIYKQTRETAKLEALEKRFAEIKVATRAEQVRGINARNDPTSWAGETVGSIDCASKKPAAEEDWELDLPSFCEGEDSRQVATPKNLTAPQPKQSDKDRDAKVEGTVEFRARLDAAGAVDRVKIINGLARRPDAATVNAICQWRFEPATTSDDEATALYFCGAVRFRGK